ETRRQEAWDGGGADAGLPDAAGDRAEPGGPTCGRRNYWPARVSPRSPVVVVPSPGGPPRSWLGGPRCARMNSTTAAGSAKAPLERLATCSIVPRSGAEPPDHTRTTNEL